MKGFFIKAMTYLIITLFAMPIVAADYIKVHIKTNDKTAACLGFAVNGVRSGSLGKSHMGSGPVNKEYVFGYRKNSVIGRDVTCGSKVLTKDSSVTLVADGEHCSIIVD